MPATTPSHEDDQERLAANEGAELEVDQVPGVAELLPLGRGKTRDEVDCRPRSKIQ